MTSFILWDLWREAKIGTSGYEYRYCRRNPIYLLRSEAKPLHRFAQHLQPEHNFIRFNDTEL